MGAIETIVDVVTDNKQYYKCPDCKKEVWAYGSFKGNTCWNCPGTVADGLGNTLKSVHPGGFIMDKVIDSNTKASFEGRRVIEIIYGKSNVDQLSNNARNDKIKSITTRYCRILHGSYSWLVNSATQTFSLGQTPLIDHWWTNIQTTEGRYYMLQFRGNFNLIELRECESRIDCDYCGLAEADKSEYSEIWTNSDYSYTYSSPSHTMNEIAQWLKSREFSPKYDLFNHNCQNLCKAFYRKF